MTPLNPELYQKAREMADIVYDRPSAFKSAYIIKKYKSMGGKFKDDNTERPLRRWFREKWRNVIPIKNGYPVYRPTVKISKEKTPLTPQEIDPKNLIEQAILKQTIREKSNLPPFKKKLK